MQVFARLPALDICVGRRLHFYMAGASRHGGDHESQIDAAEDTTQQVSLHLSHNFHIIGVWIIQNIGSGYFNLTFSVCEDFIFCNDLLYNGTCTIVWRVLRGTGLKYL